MTAGQLVLVTGGSGFIALYCIAQLLEAGYRVRTTVRSLRRSNDVLAMLKVAGVDDPGDGLSFVEADLTSDKGWPEAVAGCDFVLHVASPIPPAVPKDENELIIPAREGTLRVLEAARDAGVKRVVLTSSFVALGYSPNVDLEKTIFVETMWTDLTGADVGAYAKSKTLAERAAWEFVEKEGAGLELSVVNPTIVLGPVLGSDFSPSIQLVQRLLDGSFPGLPQLSYGIVDVRDLADLHLRAMTNPAAKGERFLAVAGPSRSMQYVATTLKDNLGDAAKRIPSYVLPNWLVRLISWFVPAVAVLAPQLGKVRTSSNEKAKRLLGWQPRPDKETIIDTAQSLIGLGLVQK